MSCAYRHAAVRIATMAGIPTDLMLTAMDIARQRCVTFPNLPPDRLHAIAPRLGITPTCGNPQQVLTRIQTTLIVLGTLHPSHPWVERGMAIAAALGVPDDHLPVPVHPDVLATVRAQWTAPPPDPAPDRTTAGIAALWRGNPIPTELIEETLRTGDRTAIVTWMAYGVWDDRFEAMCQDLTDAEIGFIVRAGVVPDAVVRRIAERWWSDSLPWEVIPFAMWDRVADATIARKGRARTAAAKLARNSTLRDDQLIAAAAEESRWAGHVLTARPDLSDERLIAAVAKESRWAGHVLTARHDLTDERLIAAAAEEPEPARDVLLARPDLHTETCLIEAAANPYWWAYDVLIKHPDRYTDEQLITVAAQHPWSACDVLLARHDLSDEHLIAAVARNVGYARDVLLARHDLRDDRLIAAAAEKPWCARDVLIARHDLSDDRLIAAVARSAVHARDVLCTRADLRTDARLLTAIARDRALADDVLMHYPDLRDHPILAAVRGPDGSSA